MTNATKPDALEAMERVIQYAEQYMENTNPAFTRLLYEANNALEAERREHEGLVRDFVHLAAEKTARDIKIREGIKAMQIRYDTCPEDCVRDNCPHPHFVPYQQTMRLLDGGRNDG